MDGLRIINDNKFIGRYFTRDKTKLDSPIQKTLWHLIRFHLGSVCLGSLIIMLVKIVKLIVDGIRVS